MPQQAGEYALRFRLTERGRQTSLSKPVRLAVRQEAAGHGILHTRDYWTLVYDDGTPFRGVAENICWESRANDDSRYFKELHEQHDKYNYDYMLPLFARNGGNFIRVWMCGFNFPIDQQDHFNNHRYTPSDAYYNPSAVARLDHFVGLCEELGVIFGICVILLSMACFLEMMRMSALIRDRFYQLIVYGIGIMYIFQIFLTIGGGIKLIPLTGSRCPSSAMEAAP